MDWVDGNRNKADGFQLYTILGMETTFPWSQVFDRIVIGIFMGIGRGMTGDGGA